MTVRCRPFEMDGAGDVSRLDAWLEALDREQAQSLVGKAMGDAWRMLRGARTIVYATERGVALRRRAASPPAARAALPVRRRLGC